MENPFIFIDGEIFLNAEELKECKENNYINKEEEICGKESLKPNLKENITVSVPHRKREKAQRNCWKLWRNLI